MMKLDDFVGMMTGHFDNKEQFDMMCKAGRIYPYAEHVNTICNDKINNLPSDFNGKFVVEESYYEPIGKRHASHIFSSLKNVRMEFCFHLTKFQKEKIKIHFHTSP